MSTRRSFLTSAAAVPLLAAVPAPAQSPSPSATPAMPTPKPTPKPPSPAASALAARSRAFDANLSEKDVDAIARGIDDNLGLGRRVNPKGRALRNSDEPATPFAVPE